MPARGACMSVWFSSYHMIHWLSYLISTCKDKVREKRLCFAARMAHFGLAVAPGH